MQNIQPFIDRGWYTVPLSGSIIRNPDGSKTIPIFEKGWKEIYTNNINKEATQIGGVLTGSTSRIIALDCDNEQSFRIFRALDPDNDAVFMSRGKTDETGRELVCGTIIYEYIDELAESFSTRDNNMALDFMSDGRMVYLPTASNTTKCAIDPGFTVKPPSRDTVALLHCLRQSKPPTSLPVATSSRHRMNLNAKVQKFVDSGEVDSALFSIITPKDFREGQAWLDDGYMHPKNVPSGRGSEYLMKVSAILGADESIDSDLYVRAMEEINGLFDAPMARTRLKKTVIEPMSLGQATGDDGTPIWQFNKNWSQLTLILMTKRNRTWHAFYDPARTAYYATDIEGQGCQGFDSQQQFITHLNSSTSGEHWKKKDLETSIPNVLIKQQPHLDFGFYGDDYFNTFVNTPGYSVFKEPKTHQKYYKHPTVILKFLESLVPDTEMREYLLRFLRRKLETMDYSPVILYFLGVPGSGKDTFVGILQRLMGEAATFNCPAQTFLENQNGWLLDKIFVQLDEYGDSLASFSDKKAAMGKLKTYTGSPSISIRKMRENAMTYEHNTTFIMTSNTNPLMLEENDRRIALFDTPNNLAEQSWVNDLGGTDAVIKAIDVEILDFAYYLATSVESLESSAYQKPPESEARAELISKSMPPQRRVAHWLKNKDWPKLRQVFDEVDLMADAEKWLRQSEILEDHLVEICDEIGFKEQENGARRVAKAMKECNIAKRRTTLPGNKHQNIYRVPGCREILNIIDEIPF